MFWSSSTVSVLALNGRDWGVGGGRRDGLGPECGGGAGHLGDEVGDGEDGNVPPSSSDRRKSSRKSGTSG